MFKACFLISLLLYLSLFPSTSPIPVVEIMEEELVVHSDEIVRSVFLAETDEPIFFSNFPDYHSLTPQASPDPEHRPPNFHKS